MKNGFLLAPTSKSQADLRKLFEEKSKKNLQKIERLIIDNRFEITQTDIRKWNILHYIARDNCTDLLNILLAHRSKEISSLMSAKTACSRTPWGLAIFRESKEVANKLLLLMTYEQATIEIDEVLTNDIENFCTTFNIMKRTQKIPSLAYIAFLELNKSAECYPMDQRAHESTHRLEFLYAQFNKHQKAYNEKQTECIQDDNTDDEDLASSQELNQMMSALTF